MGQREKQQHVIFANNMQLDLHLRCSRQPLHSPREDEEVEVVEEEEVEEEAKVFKSYPSVICFCV